MADPEKIIKDIEAGISKTKGKYVIFADSDDFFNARN